MITVACCVLPVMAALLYGMDRVEDWLMRAPKPPRHARYRRLSLVQGGDQEPSAGEQADSGTGRAA